jgi:hypothetical protein
MEKSMNRCIRYFVFTACIALPASGFAQIQPAPSREDAERNAFQTPTTGGSKQGDPEHPREQNPRSGSQGPATNPEAKNITEPTGRPTKASPNSPDK